MNDISKIDKNFAVETDLNLPDVVFYDVKENPFCLFGVSYIDGCYRRLPEDIARATNEGVLRLHKNTSGGRLRFMTDSPLRRHLGNHAAGRTDAPYGAHRLGRLRYVS